jgi:hypothetical protein
MIYMDSVGDDKQKINSGDKLPMNTSPLAITDFKEWISEDRIFKDTMSGGRFLKKWCISGGES